MTCGDVQEALVAWLDGEQGADEDRVIRAHLGFCPACGRELRQLRAVRQAIEEAFRLQPSPVGDPRLLALVERLDADELAGERGASGLRGPTRGSTAAGQRAGTLRFAGAFRPRGLGRHGRGRRPGETAGRRRWVLHAGLGVAVLALAVSTAVLVTRSGPGSGPSAEVRTAHRPKARLSQSSGDVAGTRGKSEGDTSETRVAARLRQPEASRVAPEEQAAALELGGPATPLATRDLQVPDELRVRLGLFLDLPIVQRMEKLRRLEALSAGTDERGPGGGAG